jgi:hypothetical protein
MALRATTKMSQHCNNVVGHRCVLDLLTITMALRATMKTSQRFNDDGNHRCALDLR